MRFNELYGGIGAQMVQEAIYEIVANHRFAMLGHMMKKAPKSIDAHIEGLPKHVRATLNKLRSVIRAAAPGATETIKYGIPTFVLCGKNLVHFSGYEHHIGFYPGSGAIVTFKKQLAKYDTSKGTVRFPIGDTVPFLLIQKIVKHRVKQILVRNA
jgi:uncharacterized protein YdhG (YjbR/CyaY superfamily)